MFGWELRRSGSAGQAKCLAAGLAMCLAAGLALTGTAPAQTPPSTCGADSLFLYSPDALDSRLAAGGRAGVTLSWPDLDPIQATCFAVTDTAGLDFSVSASGGFRDRVDRQLLFTADGDGTVGGAQATNLLVGWQSEGSSAYGTLAGILNLSNNGGFWTWNDGAGTWSQANAGLPMSWRQVNCVALARAADGTMLAGLTRGVAVTADPMGLYRYAGGSWTRLAPEIFDSATLITAIAVAPANSGRFAVGTASRGLFVTADGGQTFTQWRGELAPGDPVISTYQVSAMEWTASRLVVAVPNLGVFVSADDGAGFVASTFRVPSTLDVANPEARIPLVNDLASDPADPARFVAALRDHGCYESVDGGLTWTDRYGDLNVPVVGSAGAWTRNGVAVGIVAGSPSTLLMGVEQRGLYRSTNDGSSWTLVGEGIQPPTVELQKFSIANLPGLPGSVAVMEDEFGLLLTADGGANWTLAAVQPAVDKGLHLLPGAGTGDLVLGTWGGGVFAPGTPLVLSETYTSDTQPSSLRSLNLGLSVTIGGGQMTEGDAFRVKAQTFQGWAVWRSLSSDPDNMTLIGLYDRVNPEDCIVGYCGDDFQVVPRCYAAKRAACFEFSTPDTIRFFDDEIYNGFGYHYAVTSFDYGNTALASPENNSATLVFSPRWLGDTISPYAGAGNRIFRQINEPAAAAAEGDEIYAYPNPVRRGAGFPGDEGELVAFTNLPEGSSIRIFTAAGDDVRSLGAELQTGGQIYWGTDNHDGESVAPGVYLYKVEMPQREAYWGRIVVIR